MSNCIKDLCDSELVKKCYKCGIICLKSKFQKNTKSKEGLKFQCIFYVKDYKKINIIEIVIHNLSVVTKNNFQNRGKINEYIKNKMKTESHFKLASYLRNWLYKAYKAQIVGRTNGAFDLLKSFHSFFKRWVFHQLYGEMSIDNYGSVWCIDHCSPIASFNLSDEKEMKNVSIGLI